MVCLSRIFLGFFPKPAYSTLVAGKFQIYSAKITGKYICEYPHFFHTPKQNSPPGFYHYPQAEGNYPLLLNSVFRRSIFPQQKGGGLLWSWKKLPKLNLRGYWSQVLINSTILATFTFTLLVSVSCAII